MVQPVATPRKWPGPAEGFEGEAPGPVLTETIAALTATGFVPDYFSLVEPETLKPWRRGPGRLLAAARLGDVRLLDNMPLG